VEAPADLTVIREELKTELDGEDDPESKYQHAAP
jgi:sRNA-binding carbon storage regulator CsrA